METNETNVELNKVKPSDVKLMLGGRERELKFSFSVWAKLQDEYKSVSNFDKIEIDLRERPFTTIPHLIWLGLKDRDGLTEETVLDDYDITDMDYISEVVSKALYGSLPENKKKVKTNK